MVSDPSHQQIGQSVGARLRAARLAKKYTQSQLAQPDFSVSYISAIERGQIHPSLRALEIFALRLGISSTDLLSIQEPGTGGTSPESEVTPSQEEIALQLLEAEIYIWQDAARQAITQLRELASKTLTPQQEMQLHYLLGLAFINVALYQEAEAALADALKFARDVQGFLSLQVFNLLGKVNAAMHNYERGLEYYQQCLDELEKEQQFPDELFIAQLFSNMGMCYTHLNQLDVAIEMFNRALTMTEGLLTSDQLTSMYWNASHYFSETNDYHYATLYGYKSLQIYLQERNNTLRREIYHYLGQVVLKGDRQQALTELEKMQQEVTGTKDQLVQASITTHMAQWLFLEGKLDEAREQAQRAFALASPSGDTINTAYVLTTLGQVAYAQKDYAAGDSNFVSALEMLERLGLREDYAEQSAFYAQLLEERGAQEEALRYYKQAFESRRRS